ncbi:TonB-dependent siderophore receptor [Bordetella ansorpii]|uniref:TonB-dependent siderophore receptor n=1 Tax=Bordetella ansorpii TaxID=288768 RepID=A0A157MQT0_9BORD|nr:TonB-dependent siderophore receptor [Bordetella ansorpii]SAI11124.1 TonB-dependent siderophore receptor [Bordetella ansorpii]
MFRKTKLSLAISLLAATSWAQAQAQATGNADTQTLQAVTVTAQQGATKSLTPVVETPQAVTVIDREQMQAQGATSVQRATAYTAGVFSNQVGASNRFDYIVLRGFSDGSLGNTYLNGLKILGDTNSHSSLVVDPWFLDSVEVIRGPASVLYGQSSPGGIVALQTRKADFDASREIELGFGDKHQAYAAFDINQPLQSGDVAFRLAGKARRTDTQVDHVKEERYALMPSLTWKITPDTTLDVMAYLHRDPEGGYHSGLPYEGTVVPYNGRKLSRSFFEGEPDVEKYKRNQNLVGYGLEHHFNDNLSFRQNLQYLESEVELSQVYAYGWASPTTLNRYFSGSKEKLNALSVDNQFELRLNTGPVAHTLLTGMDYQWRENDVSWPSGAYPAIDAFDPSYGASATAMYPPTREAHKLKQTGFYAQDIMAWENWRLSLGGRYDKVDIRSKNLDTGVTSKLNDSQFSSRAGLLYRFDSGFAPYVSYSTAFTPTNFVDVQGNLLEPMEGRQVEAGVKYQAPGTRSTYGIAVFNIKQKNVATKEQPTDPYRAVGEIESEGVELEANTWLTKQFNVLASYTYNDVRYSKSDDGNQGNRAVYAPKHLASVWANYHHTGALQGLNTALGVRYANGIVSDRANTHVLPSYTLLDLAVGYDFKALGVQGLSARLNVQNLLDKKYVAACNSLEFCYYGAERTVTLSMNYKF